MGTFTGNEIFPGMKVAGQVPEALRAGLKVYSAAALNVLQGSPERITKWADICGVTAGEFDASIPIDITALNGFTEDTGEDVDYHQADLIAVAVAAVPFKLAVEWPSILTTSSIPMTNIANMGASVITQAARHKARLAATVLMNGRPGGKAKTYEQIGAPNGLTLFNTAHYVNPKDAVYGTFSNYFTGVGKFTPDLLAVVRTAMRMVPSPTGTAETLGLELTKIIAPSHMEEPLRQVAIATLSLQVSQVGGQAVAAAVSNVQASGTLPWSYEIAPQLDNDPYLAAFRAAFLIANSRQPTPQELPHFFIAVSESIPGAHLIEMIAPSAGFTPRISVFGVGSEHEMKREKVAIIARLRAGAAAGLPHVGARYEET
jgi:hypothetical protein